MSKWLWAQILLGAGLFAFFHLLSFRQFSVIEWSLGRWLIVWEGKEQKLIY